MSDQNVHCAACHHPKSYHVPQGGYIHCRGGGERHVTKDVDSERRLVHKARKALNALLTQYTPILPRSPFMRYGKQQVSEDEMWTLLVANLQQQKSCSCSNFQPPEVPLHPHEESK